MKKRFSIFISIIIISILAACGAPEEVETDKGETDVLITFQDETITLKDAQNAQMDPDDTLNEVAKYLLFQEVVLIEAEKAGISYDEFDLEALVNQTQQMYEFDEEAIAYLRAKSELYNITPEEYIVTIWRDFLKKRLIVNNYLAEEVDFYSERSQEEIDADIEIVRNNLLTKYEDQIEYHF